MAKNSWKLQEFVAHGSSVNCLALNHSGRTLATGGDDRKVNLWNTGKPNVLVSFTGHTSAVESVVFNEPEECIAAGSKSGSIRVFDLEQNKVIRALSGHTSGVMSLDFHRYGDILASGSMDTNLKIWDIRRKGCIITYSNHTDTVSGLQFSPDGRWVVSASADSTIRLWDLVAGKMLTCFDSHSGAVNAVKFHPKEFILATGSADRTVKIWDLEKFSLISSGPPESTPIRCITFDPDGTVLFSGSQDSLKLYHWEPTAVCLDSVHVPWGKPSDIVVYREQLIEASISQTTVSEWVVDIKTLRPFSNAPSPPGDVGLPDQIPVQKPPTSRKKFEEVVKESRPKTTSTKSSKKPEQPPVHPSKSSESVEENEEDSNVPEANPEERKEIFMPISTLTRTPPKQSFEPFAPPPPADPYPYNPPKPHPPSEDPHTPPEPHPPSADPRPPPESHPPSAAKEIPKKKSSELQQSVELPLDEFMPVSRPTPLGVGKEPPKSALTDEQALTKLSRAHGQLKSILDNRKTQIQRTKEVWSIEDPKTALEQVISMGDNAVLVDVLSILKQRKGLWSLDMCTVVLPELKGLVFSKHESHVSCGCGTMTLILKAFGPLIRDTINSPPSSGVDFSREERLKKCELCHAHLVAIKNDLLRAGDGSRSSHVKRLYRDLLSLYTTQLS